MGTCFLGRTQNRWSMQGEALQGPPLWGGGQGREQGRGLGQDSSHGGTRGQPWVLSC